MGAGEGVSSSPHPCGTSPSVREKAGWNIRRVVSAHAVSPRSEWWLSKPPGKIRVSFPDLRANKAFPDEAARP